MENFDNLLQDVVDKNSDLIINFNNLTILSVSTPLNTELLPLNFSSTIGPHLLIHQNNNKIIDTSAYPMQFHEKSNAFDPINHLTNTTTTLLANNIDLIENYTKKIQDIYENNWNWFELILAFLLCVLIVITVIGNTLVILSVLTTRRLRTVTNCFVMSLAVADWLVGIFVMPPAVAVHITGYWQLGWILCDIWISLDVLLCTASILSLCAISIDRYLAVTQPLNYSRKRRSKRLALIMILIVWVLALAITCPPILGWYEQGRRDLIVCRYNQNQGYVVFSAMGSFFIPMAVMIYVYVRISCVVASRHDHMTEIEVHKKHKSFNIEIENELDVDPTSELESQNLAKKKITLRTTSATSISKELIGTTNFNQKNGRHYELVETFQLQENRQQQQKSGANKNHRNTFKSEFEHNGNSPVDQTQPESNQLNLLQENSPKLNTPSTRHQLITTSQQNTPKCIRQFSLKHTTNSSTTKTYENCTKHMRGQTKSLSNRILTLKRENKTTQTLSIVVGGFIVCWLPFFIYYLITPFLPRRFVSGTVTNLLTWLGWFNSAMNPFIYAFYSVDFRAAFWRLTLRRFFKNTMKPPYPINITSIRR